jgi:hypothetical protein
LADFFFLIIFPTLANSALSQSSLLFYLQFVDPFLRSFSLYSHSLLP